MTLDSRDSGLQKNKALVGKQAPFDYYKDYKKLTKLREKSSNKENFEYSPYLSMLEKTQKMQLLPLTFNLIKFQGQNNILNLTNYKLGDKYIIALSAGLKKAKLIEKCYLSANRMTNKGFNELVMNLNHQINLLDVSYNQISQLDDKLMQLVTHPESHLETLNLQNNLIKNKENLTTLFENISISKHLRVLNLRSNGIMVDCVDSLCELIDTETHLQQLYLGRNFLTAKAGQKIFQVLANNKNIKVFDYSLNNLGQDENNQCAKAIAHCLTKNKTLHHVDLSSNNFSQAGSKIIAEGLQPNKKIYGFHFDGNHGFVDSKGFLIIEEKQLTSLHSLVQTKIDSYNVVFRRHNSTASPKIFKNVCWICEGWYEQEFKFNIPEQFKQDKKFVYLHFDFELFEPRLINIQQKHVKYTTMVPPTRYRYFFTFDGKQYLDKNAKVTNLQFPQTFSYQMYHELKTFTVQQLSERTKAKPKKIVNDWHQIVIKTLPRNTGLVSKKQKEKWTYEKSAWAKQWKLDNQEILKKCFERDWKCSKIMNLVKNQQDQDKVRELLYKSYKEIKSLYRNYASWSPFGDIWAVSNNVWTQFCQQSKLISKDTPLKITDLTFITTNSISGADWKGNALVPQRGLVRFQFMECLVRLAEQKFKKLGLTQNFSDSVELLLKDHVLPLAQTFNYEKWRFEKYFVQENDILVKKYRPIFNYVYKKNSKLKVKPGEKPFMCLNEFRSILQRINLAGNMVIQRDIFLGFNFSMMTQVDELENQRFMKMTEIEFIQGMARCANLLPKSCSLSSQDSDSLHLKFEWLINEIKNTLCNQDLKSQFNEQGSIFDQNEEDD